MGKANRKHFKRRCSGLDGEHFAIKDNMDLFRFCFFSLLGKNFSKAEGVHRSAKLDSFCRSKPVFLVKLPESRREKEEGARIQTNLLGSNPTM